MAVATPISTSMLLQSCADLTDIQPLCDEASLFLKPIARVTIAVQLPKSLSANPSATIGKTVSNWEVMERIKSLAKPIVFTVLKVVSSTLEQIRYEGELENKDIMAKAMHALDAQTIKLSGFSEVLRVQCVEAKLNFPHRQDWLAYFRDAKNLNETKPGERPDTVILYNLPCKWFAEEKQQPPTVTTNGDTALTQEQPAAEAPVVEENNGNAVVASAESHNKPEDANAKEDSSVLPSVKSFTKVFETFGKIRAIDLPILDPSRSYLRPSGGNGILTFGHELVFEAYIQFSEYSGFVKCLTALYGTKLLWKDAEGKGFTACIKVDFDRMQHMSDKNIKKRRHERAEYRRLLKLKEEKARIEREEEERKKKLAEEKAAEEAKRQEEARQRREERRRQRRQQAEERAERKRLKKEEEKRQREVALEERKLLIAQRQLESIRLLSVLFDRIKVKRELELAELEKIRAHEEELRKKAEAKQQETAKEKEFQSMLIKKEKELRRALMKAKKREERKQKKEEERKEKRKLKKLNQIAAMQADVEVDKMLETMKWVKSSICYVNEDDKKLVTETAKTKERNRERSQSRRPRNSPEPPRHRSSSGRGKNGKRTTEPSPSKRRDPPRRPAENEEHERPRKRRSTNEKKQEVELDIADGILDGILDINPDGNLSVSPEAADDVESANGDVHEGIYEQGAESPVVSEQITESVNCSQRTSMPRSENVIVVIERGSYHDVDFYEAPKNILYC